MAHPILLTMSGKPLRSNFGIYDSLAADNLWAASVSSPMSPPMYATQARFDAIRGSAALDVADPAGANGAPFTQIAANPRMNNRLGLTPNGGGYSANIGAVGSAFTICFVANFLPEAGLSPPAPGISYSALNQPFVVSDVSPGTGSVFAAQLVRGFNVPAAYTWGAIRSSMGGNYGSVAIPALSVSGEDNRVIFVWSTNGTTTKLYINSAAPLVSSLAPAAGYALCQYFRMHGYSEPSGLGRTNGGMTWHEAAVWKRQLSDVEVAALMVDRADYYAIPDIYAAESTITALAPKTWLRADSTVSSGGNVTDFVCRVDGTHLFSQGNATYRVPTPTVNANFNGQLTATFATSQRIYTSSKAASYWNFLLSNACNVFFIYSVKTAAIHRRLFGSSGAGGVWDINHANDHSVRIVARNVATDIANTPTVAETLDADIPTLVEYRSKPGTADTWDYWTKRTYNTSSVTRMETAGSDYLSTPGGSTGATLTLGDMALGYGSPFFGEFAEAIFFDKALTDQQRVNVLAYFAARYGRSF